MNIAKYPYNFTLRLDQRMESALEDLSHTFRTSRAGLIRRILARGISEAYKEITTRRNTEGRGGLL